MVILYALCKIFCNFIDTIITRLSSYDTYDIFVKHVCEYSNTLIRPDRSNTEFLNPIQIELIAFDFSKWKDDCVLGVRLTFNVDGKIAFSVFWWPFPRQRSINHTVPTGGSLGPGCINFPDREHPPAKSNSRECGHFRVSFRLCFYLTSPWAGLLRLQGTATEQMDTLFPSNRSIMTGLLLAEHCRK